MDLTTFISKLRDMPMANADDAPLIRLQIDVLRSFAALQAGPDEVERDLAILARERQRGCARLQSLRLVEIRPRICSAEDRIGYQHCRECPLRKSPLRETRGDVDPAGASPELPDIGDAVEGRVVVR